jgi:hypothetical protein
MIDEINELRAMEVPALVERYREVHGKEPRVRHKAFLWKRIAWRIQEQKFGGLSEAAKRRLEELIAEIDLPLGDRARTVTGVLRPKRAPKGPAVGTTIAREWRGQQITVRVVEGGFEWNGVAYRSLSAVAKAITGTHWNGRLFFGLAGRRVAR